MTSCASLAVPPRQRRNSPWHVPRKSPNSDSDTDGLSDNESDHLATIDTCSTLLDRLMFLDQYYHIHETSSIACNMPPEKLLSLTHTPPKAPLTLSSACSYSPREPYAPPKTDPNSDPHAVHT